ncbi:hypothetical protein TrST_g13735 [Triparma strigata]|nr:hypothetical protein TrST_g13735 [Triparma strigata]
MSGTFAPASGSAACTSCPPGTSSEESDDGACLACPKGKFSAKSDSCEVCPPGSFANGVGNAVCSPCPPNQFPKDDQTGCEVVTGYYNDGSEGQSVAVPVGVRRDVPGMTLNALDLEEGYWRTTSNSTEILRCISKKHCLGGANITIMCADGYTGPLCAVCESGYAVMGSGELLTCEQCTGTSIVKIIAWLIFVLVILAAAVLVSFLTSSKDRQQSIRSRSDSFAKALEKITKYTPVVKIILSYFQVTGTLGLVYGIRFPTIFSIITNIISGLFSLNLFVVMPLGCTMPAGHYASLLLYTIVPIVLTVILLGIRYALPEEYKNIRTKLFEVFLAMTFVILPGVSVKIFSTFACQKFDGDYGSYLKVD